MSKFEVRFAQNQKEKNEVYKLRYKVFNEELKVGISNNNEKIDKDKWDEQCDHIIVIEKEKNKIVGTYRLQDHVKATKGNGYQSDLLFELSDLPTSILKKSLEVSRACIQKDFRKGSVLFLLWSKLVSHTIKNDYEYLFGSVSFFGLDTENINKTYSYIKDKGYLHNEIFIRTREKQVVRELKYIPFSKLEEVSPLFKAYVKNGVKVCSDPAIDYDFKSFDFFILLNLNEVKRETINKYLKL